MPPSDPDFALNDDGTVTVVTGETTHRLRRPTIGQLRHLTGKQRALGDASVQLLVKVRAVVAPPCDQKPKESDEKFFSRRADDELAKAKAKRELDDEYEAQVVEWFRDAMVRLSDEREKVPEPDDMPSFSLDRSIPVTLLNHWRTVPLAPGNP